MSFLPYITNDRSQPSARRGVPRVVSTSAASSPTTPLYATSADPSLAVAGLPTHLAQPLQPRPPAYKSEANASTTAPAGSPTQHRTHLRIRGDWADSSGYQPGDARAHQSNAARASARENKNMVKRVQRATAIEESKQAPPSSVTLGSVNGPNAPPFSATSAFNTSNLPMTAMMPPFMLMQPFLNMPGPFPPNFAQTAPLPPPGSVGPTILNPALPPPMLPADMFLWSRKLAEQQTVTQETKQRQNAATTATPREKDDVIKQTQFVPFARDSHVLTPTAASMARVDYTEKQHHPETSKTQGGGEKGKPKALSGVKPLKRSHPFAHLHPALQDSPYNALISASLPPPSKDPNHPSNLSDEINASMLALPEGLEELPAMEREMLKHLARTAYKYFDNEISPALQPTPLEILFFMDHYREMGVMFESIQQAVEACQAEKEAARLFLNHKTRAKGLLAMWSDGSLEREKIPQDEKAAAPTEESDAPSGDAPAADEYVERVDPIDLTLLFEQTRVGSHMLMHLLNLQTEGQNFMNALELTAAVMEEEKNFQRRANDLFNFLHSDQCVLFHRGKGDPATQRPSTASSTTATSPSAISPPATASSSFSSPLISWSSVHAFCKILPKKSLNDCIIRVYSWNEQLKEKIHKQHIRETQIQRAKRKVRLEEEEENEAAKTSQAGPTSPRGKRKQKTVARKRGGGRHAHVQSKVATVWATRAPTPSAEELARLESQRIEDALREEKERAKGWKGKVFHSLDEFIQQLRQEEFLYEQANERKQAELQYPQSAVKSVEAKAEEQPAAVDEPSLVKQLSMYLLGPNRLVDHVDEIDLVQLRKLDRLLSNDDDEEENKHDKADDENAQAGKSDDVKENDAEPVPKIVKKKIPPKDDGGVSSYEQLLFHLSVIHSEHLASTGPTTAGALTPSSPRPAFSSFETLLEAVRSEHEASVKRREAIFLWLLEESDLFNVVPLRPQVKTAGGMATETSAQPHNTTEVSERCILSDGCLSQLYFRALNAKGSHLLYHLKQLLWRSIPTPSLPTQNQQASPRANPIRLEDCFQTIGSEGFPVAVHLKNDSSTAFPFSRDINALIEEIESGETFQRFQQLIQELLTFLADDTCVLLSDSIRTTNLNRYAVENLLYFSEAGSHTLSYLQKWNRQLKDSMMGITLSPTRTTLSSGKKDDIDVDDETQVITAPVENMDELVDHIIAYHVLGVKRRLVAHLESQYSHMCPALSAMTDLDIERVFSCTRSFEQILMVLKLVEQPTLASVQRAQTQASGEEANNETASPTPMSLPTSPRSNARGLKDKKAKWVDNDSSVPTLYPSLSDFLMELRHLSDELQSQLDGALQFLTDKHRCSLWSTAQEDLIHAELKSEPTAVLKLFRNVGLDALPHLIALNKSLKASVTASEPTSSETSKPKQFYSLDHLHDALVSHYRESLAHQIPKRTKLREFLENEHTWLLRPFFREKLLMQRREQLEVQQRQQRAKRRATNVRGSVTSISSFSSVGSTSEFQQFLINAGYNNSSVANSNRGSVVTTPTFKSSTIEEQSTEPASRSGDSKHTFPLTDRQIDGLLSAVNQRADILLTLLQYLNDLYAEFATLEELHAELLILFERTIAAREAVRARWTTWSLINVAQPAPVKQGTRNDQPLEIQNGVIDIFDENSQQQEARAKELQHLHQQQLLKLKQEQEKEEEAVKAAAQALIPSPTDDDEEDASRPPPFDLRLVLESQAGPDVISFLESFVNAGHTFRSLEDLIYFLRKKWHALLRARRRLMASLCSSDCLLFAETESKRSARQEILRQDRVEKEEVAREAKEKGEALAKAANDALAAVAASATPGAEPMKAEVDSTETTASPTAAEKPPTEKRSRANRRGSMVGNLLPVPLNASSDAQQPVTSNSDATTPQSASASEVALVENDTSDTQSPSTSYLISPEQDWIVTHRGLHDLLVQVGPLVSFWINALQQRQHPPPPVFQSEREMETAIIQMQQACQNVLFHFVTDGYALIRQAAVPPPPATANSETGRKTPATLPVKPEEQPLPDFASRLASDVACLPHQILQEDVHEGPANPLFAESFISQLLPRPSNAALAAKADVTILVEGQVFDATHPRIKHLLEAAVELTPYSLFYHLSHLTNPFDNPSPRFDVYRQFVRADEFARNGGKNPLHPSAIPSRDQTLPFTSWEQLVEAIRICQQSWLHMREQVYELLVRNQSASAAQQAQAAQLSDASAATTMVASPETSASVSAGFIPFFPPTVRQIRWSDVDELLQRCNAGFDTIAWLQLYQQTQQRSSMLSDNPQAVQPMFEDLASLTERVTQDGFLATQATALSRNTLLAELQKQKSKLFEQAVEIRVQDLDALLDLVGPLTKSPPAAGAVEAAEKLLTPTLEQTAQSISPATVNAPATPGDSPVEHEEVKSSNELMNSPDSSLSLARSTALEDVIWLIQYLVGLNRAFPTWASFCQTLSWHWQELHEHTIPDVCTYLNTGSARALCGFLAPYQLVSMDGAERLARQCMAGVYTVELLTELVEGASFESESSAQISAEPDVNSSQAAMEQFNASMASAANSSLPVYLSLNDAIFQLKQRFLTQFLPVQLKSHKALLHYLGDSAPEFFHDVDKEPLILDRNTIWDLMDRSGARMHSLALCKEMYEEFRLFKNVAQLTMEVAVRVQKEKKHRSDLQAFFEDRSNLKALFEVDKQSPQYATNRASVLKAGDNVSLPVVTNHMIDRMLIQGQCGLDTFSLIKSWTQSGNHFPSFADLILVLHETSQRKETHVKNSLHELRSFFTDSNCFLLPASVRIQQHQHQQQVLRDRDLRHALKVCGSDEVVCMTLLRYMNEANTPINTSPAASPSAETTAEYAPVTAFNDFPSFLSALLAKHRQLLSERDRVVDFFATAAAPLTRDESVAAATLNLDRCRLWAQLWQVDHVRVEDKPPESNDPEAASALLAHRALVASSNNLSSHPPIPHLASPGKRNSLTSRLLVPQSSVDQEAVPLVDASAAMRLMVASSSGLHTLHFLLAINRAEPYAFRDLDSLTLALRNAFLGWKEAKRSIATFLQSKQCCLLPKKNLNDSVVRTVSRVHSTAVLAAASELKGNEFNANDSTTSDSFNPPPIDTRVTPYRPLTYRNIDRMLMCYHGCESGLFLPHILLNFLRTLNQDKIKLHINPRAASLGLVDRSTTAATQADVPPEDNPSGVGLIKSPSNSSLVTNATVASTVVFGSVKELCAYLRSVHAEAFQVALVDVVEWMNSSRCLLLNGPTRSATGENILAEVGAITPRDAQKLMRESDAHCYLLQHLHNLQRRGFRCSSLQALIQEVKERVKWEGIIPVAMATFDAK